MGTGLGRFDDRGHGRRPALLTADEVAAVRRPYRAASLLPARAYHDPAFLAYERAEWFRRDWSPVARLTDVAEPGSYVLGELDGESLIIVRGRDGELRAFTNVCRHRGSQLVEAPAGHLVRIQCPYHAWVYDLDGRLMRARHTDDLEDFEPVGFGLAGVRVATWQGFVFATFDPAAPALDAWLDDLPAHLARFDFSDLRVAHALHYEVAANWKLIAENYSECYHCPGLHPQLNRLTPYDRGGDYATRGPWQGGWMELVDGAETMAAGGERHGRPTLCGMTATDERRIDYYLLWPLTFLSIHPDYLLVHRLAPLAPDRTRVSCEFLFEPATMTAADFDPSDAIAFWDETNRQDWHACELQQRGTASASFRAGRFTTNEPSVHAFDLMCVDRYAGDGVSSRRTVRDRYDVPPPKLEVSASA